MEACLANVWSARLLSLSQVLCQLYSSSCRLVYSGCLGSNVQQTTLLGHCYLVPSLRSLPLPCRSHAEHLCLGPL